MFLARQLDEDITIPAYQRTGDFFQGADGIFLPWPGIEGWGSIHAGPFLGEASVSEGEGFHSVYLQAFASDGIPLPVQLLTREARLAFPLVYDQKGTRYKAEAITGYTYYKHLLSGTEPYAVPVSTQTITSMDWTVRPEEPAVVFQVNAELRFTLQSLDEAGVPFGTEREYTVGIPIFSVLVHRK
jgi:hypothetical protein